MFILWAIALSLLLLMVLNPRLALTYVMRTREFIKMKLGHNDHRALDSTEAETNMLNKTPNQSLFHHFFSTFPKHIQGGENWNLLIKFLPFLRHIILDSVWRYISKDYGIYKDTTARRKRVTRVKTH